MPETPQTQQEVSELTTRVANIESMVRFGLASNREAKDHARRHFDDKKHSPELYLALKEPKSQKQLQAGLHLSQPNIAKICAHLEEQGFITRDRVKGQTTSEWVYRWDEVERILGLSKIARDCARNPKK